MLAVLRLLASLSARATRHANPDTVEGAQLHHAEAVTRS
jgi:hypothetical protein